MTKNFKKAIGRFNLQQRYNNDAQFAQDCRRIVALAFVPINHLDDAFEQLNRDSLPEIEPVLDWFEDNYLGRPNRRATFPPEVNILYFSMMLKSIMD